MDIYHVLGEQYSARQIPEVVSLGEVSIVQNHRNKVKLTPSTSHCAATLRRIGAKLSNLFLPVYVLDEALLSSAVIHWSIWR